MVTKTIGDVMRYLTPGWILLVLLQTCAALKFGANLTLNLCVLLPVSNTMSNKMGEGLQVASEIAPEEIRARNILTGNFTVNMTFVDTACDQLKAVSAVNNMREKDGFIGPACSTECMSAALLGAALNKPLISYSCSSLELSNRQLYPTFARTQPFSRTYEHITPQLLMSYLKYYKWTSNIAIISSEDYIWAPLAVNLKALLIKNNITVPYLGLYSSTSNNYDQYRDVVSPIQMISRVVIILAYSEEAARVLWTADQLGMRNGEYAFITLDFDIEDRWQNNTWPFVPKDTLFATFNGIIDMAVGKARGQYWPGIKARLTAELKSRGIPPDDVTVNFGGYLIDAVLLYAYGVNATLCKGGDYRNGKDLITNISTSQELFEGATGIVGINSLGDRIPYFMFSNRQNGIQIPFIEFNLLKKETDPEYFKVFNTATLVWPGGGAKIPLAVPVCGFRGQLCIKPEDENLLYYLYLIIPVVLIIIAIIAALYYRKKLYERSLMDESWLIKYDDLVHASPGSRYSSKVRSRVSLNSSGGFSNHVQKSDLARYKGELVVQKKLRREQVNLTREILVEMKEVRDLHHANLNQYVGVCVESPNICTVSVFCNRGSLQDLLANDNIKLDWMFRQSFANDIASGMDAIHNSPIHAHGNLKSSNCLIDSRWVCKITDYGMDQLRASQADKDIGEFAKYRDLFWTAPELLCSSKTGDRSNKTTTGDVYSYGVILYEIMTRDEPYSANMETLSSKEVIDLVRKRQSPPFRPQFPKYSTEKQTQKVMQLISDCWDDDPIKRPTFSNVKKTLKALGIGKNLNIVDNMITMMAKYTDQLEDIVEERTKQLAEEKAKTDELLYKMLPRSIADELKKGNLVTAESFQSVTIFFSDIVGFTSVAAQSTPLQVVDLLNKLYTRFDKVVDEHDVYKVETIGDAYMVVSGLPVRNGERHAGEVASMALNLLSEVRDFEIPHIPSRKVQLRIGIHSGSCVAGVVGLKMPRYCLFGDTVNYASRMESSGLALRIHVSPECKEVLDRLGGYHLDERGPVSMKGKGTIVTFFLVGKDGFDKPLPDLRYAASLADHEFK